MTTKKQVSNHQALMTIRVHTRKLTQVIKLPLNPAFRSVTSSKEEKSNTGRGLPRFFSGRKSGMGDL